MSELRPIGDFLKGVTIRDEDGNEHPVEVLGDAPSPQMLLDPRITPPREAVERRLAWVEGRLAKEWIVERTALEREQKLLQKQLAWNDLRDTIQATRPEGCWCLGAGFRLPLPHEARVEPIRAVTVEGDEGAFASYDVIAPVRAIYCTCPAAEVARQAHAEARAADEALKRRVRVDRLMEMSGIPRDAIALSSKTWLAEIQARDPAAVAPAREVLHRIAAWATTDDWLWIEGPWGRGKTVLLWIVCRLLAEQHGQVVTYRTAPGLLDAMRAAYDPHGHHAAVLVRSLVEADVLAIDDLGKERPSAWVQERLYSLVNERAVRGRRMLFTSNLALGGTDLPNRLDEAVIQRIRQRCGPTGILHLDGPNLRDSSH